MIQKTSRGSKACPRNNFYDWVKTKEAAPMHPVLFLYGAVEI